MTLSKIDRIDLAALAVAIGLLWLLIGCSFDNRVHIRQGVEPPEAIAINDFSVGLGGIKGFEDVPNFLEGHIEAGRTIIKIESPALTLFASVALTGSDAGAGVVMEVVVWLFDNFRRLSDWVWP